MLHSLSVQVIAEWRGRDADALWQCSVDAQTGPFRKRQPAQLTAALRGFFGVYQQLGL